jgi:type II secretory pathway component PulK
MKAVIHSTNHSQKDGFALVVTMLVVLVVSALTTGAVLVGGNHILANRYYERTNQLQIMARSGLEYARALVNGDPTLYPDSAYATLEDGAPVKDG